MAKFEIFRGVSDYRFRFKANNGEQILSSEGYVSKQGCQNAIASVKINAPYDSTYHRSDSYMNYRFNMVAKNGEIIARSSEGYVNRQGRENAIDVVKREAPAALVYDLT